jgi:hypothetical protein
VSATSKPPDFTESREAPPPVQWRSWPLCESIPTSVAVVGGLLAAGAGVGWITGQMHLALLAMAVLVLASWRFFLPKLFELNAEGVNQWLLGRHRRIPWREIRRYEVRSSGVLLLPHADARPVDVLGGLYLPWGRRRDEVLAQVRYHLDRPSGA